MTEQQIKDIVSTVSKFEEDIHERVDALLKIKRVRASFDHVKWDYCDPHCLCVQVWDGHEMFGQYFPAAYLADDFDLDGYRRRIDESIENKERLAREAEERKELEEYERLKRKFENASVDLASQKEGEKEVRSNE